MVQHSTMIYNWSLSAHVLSAGHAYSIALVLDDTSSVGEKTGACPLI
jgi:hypothetical protein